MSGGTARDVASVVESAGEIVGRTRLQKTVSLLEMAGVGYGFSFSYYKFGPFSDSLAISTDRASALGYVTEIEKRATWGGQYSIFRASEHRLTGNASRDRLIEIARDADAVALELAVTAAFLAREGRRDVWTEVARRKPEKSDSDKIDSAKKLYATILSVPGIESTLPRLD